jgi:hypothetical protein
VWSFAARVNAGADPTLAACDEFGWPLRLPSNSQVFRLPTVLVLLGRSQRAPRLTVTRRAKNGSAERLHDASVHGLLNWSWAADFGLAEIVYCARDLASDDAIASPHVSHNALGRRARARDRLGGVDNARAR